MLTEDQICTFRRTGHLTVANVFTKQEMDDALADLDAWSKEFLAKVPETQRAWYLESNSERPLLRKLDNPVFHRQAFRSLASHPRMLPMVHQLIGQGVAVFFSQVFMKPPEVGGPKPLHQDNFYFGPDCNDATLTAWIALDDATVDNGCLHYSDVHQDAIVPHIAPPGEPFNLQILPEIATRFQLRPAPVARGGVSFHHGNTPHQSSANRSSQSRRATAFHYLHHDAQLVSSTLAYDASVSVAIS